LIKEDKYMTISRKSADAAKTYPGQKVTYPYPMDNNYQEKEIEIHGPQASTPVMYAQPKITFVRDGAEVNKKGEQSYTRPNTVKPAPNSV
jgi:hypothetical protein